MPEIPPDPAARKPDEVRQMFARVAPAYDKINRAMTFGLDAVWRRKLATLALRDSLPEQPVLDLACGSGDVALEMFKLGANTCVTCSDLCPDMLELAQAKIAAAGFSDRAQFIQADACALPFPEGAFGACTISFGFRNFQDRPACLREIRRVLGRGASLYILEVSRASKIIAPVQNLFMEKFVPTCAGMLGGNKSDYAYLAKTTRSFPRPALLKKMLEDAGFSGICHRSLGFGMVALTSAKKA